MIKPFYLLSYPRSGNHWARYIIEYFSGYPTSHEGARDVDSPLYAHYDAPVLSRCGISTANMFDGRPFIAFKRHFIYEHDSMDKPLLVILRPWQEAVTRHLSLSGVSDFSITNEHVKRELEYWAQHLIEYANWPMTKSIVYYSELILSPKAAIRAIAPFLPEPIEEKAIADFMENIEQHKENAFATVAAKQNTSFDNGTNKWGLVKHSQILSDNDKADWEAYLSSLLKLLDIDMP